MQIWDSIMFITIKIYELNGSYWISFESVYLLLGGERERTHNFRQINKLQRGRYFCSLHCLLDIYYYISAKIF